MNRKKKQVKLKKEKQNGKIFSASFAFETTSTQVIILPFSYCLIIPFKSISIAFFTIPIFHQQFKFNQRFKIKQPFTDNHSWISRWSKGNRHLYKEFFFSPFHFGESFFSCYRFSCVGGSSWSSCWFADFSVECVFHEVAISIETFSNRHANVLA